MVRIPSLKAPSIPPPPTRRMGKRVHTEAKDPDHLRQLWSFIHENDEDRLYVGLRVADVEVTRDLSEAWYYHHDKEGAATEAFLVYQEPGYYWLLLTLDLNSNSGCNVYEAAADGAILNSTPVHTATDAKPALIWLASQTRSGRLGPLPPPASTRLAAPLAPSTTEAAKVAALLSKHTRFKIEVAELPGGVDLRITVWKLDMTPVVEVCLWSDRTLSVGPWIGDVSDVGAVVDLLQTCSALQSIL